MSEIQCVFYERVPRLRRLLRRLTFDHNCGDPSQRVCEASIFLDEIDWLLDHIVECFEWPHEDPLWPKRCPRCPYEFVPGDYWQVSTKWLYKDPNTGAHVAEDEMPPGALYRAHWLEDMDNYKGPDGWALICKLPYGGEWLIDGPSKDGGRWTRTGTVPRISATPSILTSGYHGYLTDGVLRAC
jgi:hypothetical protein